MLLPGSDGPIAVAAVSKWGAKAIGTRDVSGALASAPLASRPDIVHVVDEIPLTNWYRPDATELAARGLPKAGPRTWVRDPESGAYSRLTKAVRERLQLPAGQDAPLLGRGIDLLRLAAVHRDSNRRMAENLRQ